MVIPWFVEVSILAANVERRSERGGARRVGSFGGFFTKRPRNRDFERRSFAAMTCKRGARRSRWARRSQAEDG